VYQSAGWVFNDSFQLYHNKTNFKYQRRLTWEFETCFSRRIDCFNLFTKHTKEILPFQKTFKINTQKGICNLKTFRHCIQSHGQKSCFVINLEKESDYSIPDSLNVLQMSVRETRSNVFIFTNHLLSVSFIEL
jgi:hypothetical protein